MKQEIIDRLQKAQHDAREFFESNPNAEVEQCKPLNDELMAATEIYQAERAKDEQAKVEREKLQANIAGVEEYLRKPISKPTLYLDAKSAKETEKNPDKERFAKMKEEIFFYTLRRGMKDVQGDAEKFCKEHGIKDVPAYAEWNENNVGTRSSEVHAMVVGDMILGGALVPEQTTTEIVRNATAKTPLLGLVRTVPITGPYLPLMKILPATAADAAGIYPSKFDGNRFVNEAEATSILNTLSQDQPQTGREKIVVHRYKPKKIFASKELLNDGPAFKSEFDRVMNETYGLDRLRLVISGTGADQPLGVLNDPQINAVARITNSGVAGEFAFDTVLDLIYDLPEGYAEDPSCALALRRAAYGRLLKVKDDAGNYVIPPNTPPMTIHGYKIVTTAFVPAVATDAIVGIFGCWNYYVMPMREELNVGVLDQIAWPDVYFQPTARFGGLATQPEAFRLYKLSA